MVDTTTCPNCGKDIAHGAFLESDHAIELPCSCEPATDALTLILLEMRAIRALLERQTAVIAWHSGLQRSPFSPSPVDPEQAAEEARSAALARQSADPGVSLTRIDSL